MHLRHLVVVNFRGLEALDVEFDNLVNVIVGPNAIGKTTVLEAIRLTKALLAPRTQTETQQALFALGAAVPHNPQRIYPEAIARDTSRPIEIRCTYVLEGDELTELASNIQQLALQAALNQMGQQFGNPGVAISVLSSGQGNALVKQMEEQFRKWLREVQSGSRKCILGLQIDPSTSRVAQSDSLFAIVLSFLEQRLRPNVTRFSYFPADRALPFGEQPVQLGAADAALQIEAHMAQPQLKYSRLKNTIFNAVVTSPQKRQELEDEFARIFDGILKGRRFIGAGINERGLLSIRVQDTETNREFDLDAMSSGEKGLVLTFLLIGQSMTSGGLILLDEPELHLNPAVCKSLLTFLVDRYVLRSNLQVIVCTHSPEIVAGAFEKPQCSLYHLKSERVLTKVRGIDATEITEVLRRLGSSESEALLYKGTIFVEGDDDVELLETGFGELLRSYKLKPLGGRSEIEKEISRLQQLESDGEDVPATYFIFDRDEKITVLKSSDKVRILQWQRRCLENYLLDIDILTTLLQKAETSKQPIYSLGEVRNRLKDLAMLQLTELAARHIHTSYGFGDVHLRSGDIKKKTVAEMAQALFSRIENIQRQICGLSATWETEFISKCDEERLQLQSIWEATWIEDSDGKRLFVDLHQSVQLLMSPSKFKKQVISEMRLQQRDSWRLIESQIRSLLA
jgi:predicted ATPase